MTKYGFMCNLKHLVLSVWWKSAVLLYLLILLPPSSFRGWKLGSVEPVESVLKDVRFRLAAPISDVWRHRNPELPLRWLRGGSALMQRQEVPRCVRVRVPLFPSKSNKCLSLILHFSNQVSFQFSYFLLSLLSLWASVFFFCFHLTRHLFFPSLPSLSALYLSGCLAFPSCLSICAPVGLSLFFHLTVCLLFPPLPFSPALLRQRHVLPCDLSE